MATTPLLDGWGWMDLFDSQHSSNTALDLFFKRDNRAIDLQTCRLRIVFWRNTRVHSSFETRDEKQKGGR